ncbi:alpha-glucosidase [Croceivirga lutea]|uniref:glycoside hydrolase family 97 protein n=1 Tax=Croceivirga lutea TaxID=1775167 RepID=UPI00163A4871|nr:glycoside hydrolase family 97 protein [Croceivirga lutea]GGG49482.1 alpha-glucosidase [Croceivirga lutea]
MQRFNFILLTFLILVVSSSCTKETFETSVQSPSKTNTFNFFLTENGTPMYTVSHGETMVIDTSDMGFEFKDQEAFSSGFKIVNTQLDQMDETWEMPWGEQRKVRNYYNGLLVQLEEEKAPNRKLDIHIKSYDDGVAFRYEFPEQEGRDSIIITEENTQFQLTEDYTTWWIPGDWDIYEHLYNTTKLSKVDATAKRNHPDLAATYIPENAVNTPVTMRGESGIHLTFHEANLTNYAGMTLKVDTINLGLTSGLVHSDRLGYAVKTSLPAVTPWRTIQIAEKAGDLIESRLIENLNEPNKLGDVSWFTPMKYAGIWWEMHLGLSTWDLEATQDMNTFATLGKKQVSVTHGATTENTKRYIDFAAANKLGGVLVEGWNTGWNYWIGFEDREGVFDFVTPYEDYDLDELSAYAKNKGVELIMHHETSAAPRTYEQQMDSAYQLMQKHGLHAVKSGYVGKIIPKGEYHHGQWMVNHYRKALEKAAEYKVAVNAHEPIKSTGLRRTLPNEISKEGLRGQEFNAWATDGGNPPEHLPIVAFTRMLAGPIDFTPGVFDISLPTKPDNQINTTLAQQLALYVVIYSPIQMACDLPQNYEGRPALQFIRDVGVDWEQTKVLNGEVGDFVTIAREERETGNWFIGGITDENERQITIDFDFLPENTNFKAAIYRDAEDAHYQTNPEALSIEQLEIKKGDTKTISLAPGGGFAISLIK